MFSRPDRDESEEDLLRFQREFLSRGSAPSASVCRVLPPQPRSSSSGILSSSPTAVPVDSEDVSREKRPHERDVIHLQGNENVEAFLNPPRKRSKFKERQLPSQRNPSKNENPSTKEDIDAADLLDTHDTHISVLLSQIKERDTKMCPIVMPSFTSKGFPTVLHRNTVELSSSGKESNSRQSLFAKQFAKSEEKDFGIVSEAQLMSRSKDGDDVEEDMLEDDACFSMSSIVSGEGLKGGDFHNSAAEVQQIHEANVTKLLSMSAEEIMNEQARLKQIIDPSILKFLQERRKQQNSGNSEQNVSESCEDDEGIGSNIVDEVTNTDKLQRPGNEPQNMKRSNNEAEEILGRDVSEKWLHMDQVEPEKLEWMKKCEMPSAKKLGTNEQVRFDFDGNVVLSKEYVPGFLGLHHHGKEPERAGYSLEELFLLSRSNFLQQRVLAINVLAKIIEKDRRGIFHGRFDQALCHTLLDAGLPFLLRWSLDDNTDTLIVASIACFTAILVVQHDELAADRLCCSWYRGNELPCLCPVTEEDLNQRTDDELSCNLTDVDAVKQDLVKGLLQMRLVPRLRFILETCRPSAPVVSNILDILIRISRHSTEAAHSVAKCPRLLEIILVQFIPNSWKMKEKSYMVTDVYGRPLAKALKLFRVLCSAGKYLADTLVSKFDLITKILRFVTVPADQMQLDVVEALELATESFRIWSTCVAYGLACDVFSDAYSHIVSQVQSLSSLPLHGKTSLWQHNNACGCALVTLIDAVTHVAGSKAELQAQLTTKLSKDKEPGGMDASHLPPSPVVWSHVTGLLPVIGDWVRLLKDQFLGLDDNAVKEESFLLLSSIFNLLASFYQKLVTQPSYSPVDCLEEIETFLVNDICVPIMASNTMKRVLSKMSKLSAPSTTSAEKNIGMFGMLSSGDPTQEIRCSQSHFDAAEVSGLGSRLSKYTHINAQFLQVVNRDYSSYYEREQASPATTSLPNLPDYGLTAGASCSTTKDGHFPRCIRSGTAFAFLLSFVRLSTVITSCHKGVAEKFLPLITSNEIIQYLKTNSTPGRNDRESQFFFVKVEQHFQYFLIKLFSNILLQCGSRNGQLTALYHTASLLLFSRLFPGDEYYAHDLMSTVIFNSAFFHESKDESATTITSGFSEMGIEPPNTADSASSKKEKCFTRGELLSEAHKDLLSIRSTFMSSFAQMRHALAKSRARSLHQPQNIESFLLPLVDGTMLPLDWMFLPLVDLHNKAVKSELTAEATDRPLNGSGSVVKRTLQWVLLLEEWRPVVLHKVSYTARIARLMCTFLTGNDLFLDNLVHNYLKTLFHSYTHQPQLANLDFNSPVPGISSFYDLFSSFLVQYEAVSYGDALFSSFLLLPLQQRCSSVLRKTVWSDHVSLFRSFSLSFDELPVPIEYYLVPVECNFEILTLQLRALVSGTLRQSWSPVFYLIAVHHICSFIFTKPDIQNSNSFNQKFKMMNQVLMVADETIRNDIICYWKPTRDSPKGFLVFSSLPPTRELLLRNKHEPEEAWKVWNQST